ncbi:hypothetical protein FIBSPDRAFT_762296, partial [Athelia psychrophila]
EELLIVKLIGSHSGENLASAVWKTLELYELQAINCDNTSNNDTMVDALAKLSMDQGCDFNADEGRL